MKQIDLLPEQRENLLRDMWILHDARWFLKTAVESGFETATLLNLAVVKSFGRTEIKRLLAATDFGRITNMEDLERFMALAADLYFPEEHVYRFEIPDKNTLVGRVVDCYVYRHVTRAGTTDIHQCAARTRFESWLEALGLEGEVLQEKNTDTCGGGCEIRFSVKW